MATINHHESAGNQIPPQSLKEFWEGQLSYAEGLARKARFELGRIATDDSVLIKAAESQGVADE